MTRDRTGSPNDSDVMIGSSLTHYRITAKIGEGGMVAVDNEW